MIKQCKINHGIMPFWINATREECDEIGFEVMEEREITDLTEKLEGGK